MSRKVIFILMMCLFASAGTYGQWYGHNRSLSDLNEHELRYLYARTKNTYHSGMFLAIGGTSCAVVGIVGIYILLINDMVMAMTGEPSNSGYYYFFGGLFYGGVISTMAGVPLWIIGEQHHHVIVNQMKQQNLGSSFRISPFIRWPDGHHAYAAGISLSLRF